MDGEAAPRFPDGTLRLSLRSAALVGQRAGADAAAPARDRAGFADDVGLAVLASGEQRAGRIVQIGLIAPACRSVLLHDPLLEVGH